MTTDMQDNELAPILDTITEIGGITVQSPESDFYDAGVTSVMALPILIELETRFNVTIPDDQFISARTPRALCEIINRLKTEQAQ